jgi:hypothetical protein
MEPRSREDLAGVAGRGGHIFSALRARTRARVWKILKFFNLGEFMVAKLSELRIATQRGILKGFWNRWQIWRTCFALSITAATINRTNYKHHANNDTIIISIPRSLRFC